MRQDGVTGRKEQFILLGVDEGVMEHYKEEMYWFPIAAIINYHKLGGLKHQKSILSQFWRPEALSKCVGRAPCSQL